MPTISAKTINNGHLVHVAALFNWAAKEEWADANPFTGLTVADHIDDADRRDPFTTEQLNALFAGEPWAAPPTPDMARPGRYWLPLLALWQGARRGEIAGLRVQDVEKVDGIWARCISARMNCEG